MRATVDRHEVLVATTHVQSSDGQATHVREPKADSRRRCYALLVDDNRLLQH
jgi:hypothetical protein